MSPQVLALLGALLGLIGGGWLGFVLGRRFRARSDKRLFWISTIASVLLGMLIIFAGEMVGVAFLAGLGVGIVTGGLNGLRWGMGRLADTATPHKHQFLGEAPPPQAEKDAPRREGQRPHPIA